MSGLLENILKESSLNYISDLSGRAGEVSVRNAIKRACLEEYELKEWVEAIEYLTGGEKRLSSMEEIRDFIENL